MGLISMTGFGSAAFDAGDARYECTIRSVNRRHMDLTLRLPPELVNLEPAIRRPVQTACQRGDIVLVIERVGGTGCREVHVDETAARALNDAYRKVAKAVGASEPVPLSTLLTASGVVRLGSGGPPGDEVSAAVLDGIQAALDDLNAARSREGRALQEDIVGRMDAIRGLWREVREEMPVINQALLDRAAVRARAVAETANVDVEPAVLATALATVAEKADVSEEVSRMDAHTSEFDSLVLADPPHGRKLDFLAQEMMREVGTTAAKCQSARVSHVVVEIKAEIERIREQLANVL